MFNSSTLFTYTFTLLIISLLLTSLYFKYCNIIGLLKTFSIGKKLDNNIFYIFNSLMILLQYLICWF